MNLVYLRDFPRTFWAFVSSPVRPSHQNSSLAQRYNTQRTLALSDFFLSSILIGAALFLYVGTAVWPDTPDGTFHLQRVRALSEALQAGMLFPRWFSDFTFGYGYPVFNFYAPAFYYPPALLHLAGLDLMLSVRLTLALFFAGSGLTMFVFLRSWARPAAACLGAVVYLFYPYHLYDLFVRGALPEFAAFLWPPLIAYFGYRLLMRTSAVPDLRTLFKIVCSRNFIGLIFAWTGLILTHNLTAFMALILSLVVYGWLTMAAALPWFRRDRSGQTKQAHLAAWWSNLVPQGVALMLGFMLSAFYLAPALLEAGWVTIGAYPDSTSYRAHFITWSHLFTWTTVYTYPSAAAATVPTPVYALFIILIAASVLPTRWTYRRRLPLLLLLFATLFTLWLMTSSSAMLWQEKFTALSQLHFPWRWYTIFAPLLAVLTALLFDLLRQKLAHRLTWLILFLPAIVFYLILTAVLRLPKLPTKLQSSDITPASMWAFEAEQGQVGTSWMAEFLPRWVSEQRWAIGREPTVAPANVPMAVPGFQMRPLSIGYLDEEYAVTTRQPLSLTWPIFYYPAWQVTVDGKSVATRARTPLGLLGISLPAGIHHVQRQWAATPAVWFGNILTGLVGMVIVCLLLVGRASVRQANPRSYAQWLWRGGGLLVGIFLLIGLLWLPAPVQQPQPLGIDYANVRLEAVMTPIAHAGETLAIQLWWSTVGPVEPLTAFVHVVAADGRVVAQHDGPLAGNYMPSTRWLPGQLLSNRYPIALPANLPPGRYTLKVGLYRPGQADQPLAPLHDRNPDRRVDVGILEIR